MNIKAAIGGWLWWILLSASAPMMGQLSTADHLADPGFWPTQTGASREEYVGSQVCAKCHAGKVAAQKTTAMAQTSMPASRAQILAQYPAMQFTVGKYEYAIRSQGQQKTYTVSDGTKTLSASLLWAFGNGRVGQSYLFKKDDDTFYEARVTYFETLKNLNFTPARSLRSAQDVEEAMGRAVPRAEVARCFACHSTASSIGNRFDEGKLMLGVSCEACHGAGAKHVAAAGMASLAGTPDAARGTIFNAAQLNPVDSVDFCGACHTTFWDVKLTGAKGVATAKSQPFRLEESKCWGKGDARVTCIACHDPHEPLQTESASYDGACLRCHALAGAQKKEKAQQKACPVANQNCASCHMPREFDPEMHYAFTDHRIRVVPKGESFPD